MTKEVWINLETFNFEVKVTNLAQGKTMKILLTDNPETVTMDLDVGEKTFKTTKCNDQSPIFSFSVIKNDGIGTWSFKDNSGVMEIRQDGELLFSYDDPCLMEHVSLRIQFPPTDKISEEFRLQPGMLL